MMKLKEENRRLKAELAKQKTERMKVEKTLAKLVLGIGEVIRNLERARDGELSRALRSV